ncbi:MAG TPA: DUF4918 family protein [Cyclobacteriaceae bacterium]|nr:DUF4918 family protein [Cyclobacteriaceae bacterium]
MFSASILSFLKQLSPPPSIPKSIAVMNPYQDEYVFKLCQQFYEKYYNDSKTRTLMLGINPGRLGSGITGISFTDPVRLEIECGIKNTLDKKSELSADFIYRMISAYGGLKKFYQRYFISALSPLGFTKGGKNINYYDDPKLEKSILPFIIKSVNQLKDLGVSGEQCFCIGEGKNYKFLKGLNQEHQWFKEITPLAHPRFIMQYKRKQLESYIDRWCNLLQ